MTNYDIAKLVKNTKDILLPKIVERLKTERKYRKLLRKIIKAAGNEISATLLVMYAQSIEDDTPTDIVALMLAVALAIDTASKSAIGSMSALLTDEMRYLDNKFAAAIKRVTGIDVGVFVRPDDMDSFIKQVVERNTSLITSLSDETREKVKQAVIDAQINKKTKTELKRELKKVLDKQAKRADLIASDQLEKLSAEVTAKRAQQAGLRWYIWRTQNDGRVRKKHRGLGGKEQDSKDPKSGDDGMLPRQPIRCRCWAQWIIKT